MEDNKPKCNLCGEELDLQYEAKYSSYFEEDLCNCNTIKLIKDFENKIKQAQEEKEKRKNLEREFAKLLNLLQDKFPEAWKYWTSRLIPPNVPKANKK